MILFKKTLNEGEKGLRHLLKWRLLISFSTCQFGGIMGFQLGGTPTKSWK
jgi:hypothetical protein